MPNKRYILLIAILGVLVLFLWATDNINRDVEISSFTTSLQERTNTQIENLQMAAVKIDGIILEPGEVFSFNEIVGPRLELWGYRGAPTIYQGKVVNTPGGGLCQLSSTLYNLALLGGLEVIERYSHLWTINSVGPGRDAAIYYSKTGNLDLKFVNTYNYPIKIQIDITENRMYARLMAPKANDHEISIDVVFLQIIPPPRYPQLPSSNKEEQDNYGKKGKDGYKVKVYRIFSQEGKVIKREPISVDKYEPVPGTNL
ncbi:MAG: VanW family protein [Vulcanimicrobiota bacterium]